MRYLVLALIAAGCYSPSYGDCQVSCAMSQQCPAGLECVGGTVCRPPGMTGPCNTPDAAGSDAGTREIPIAELQDAQLASVCDYFVRCDVFEDAPSCLAVLGGILSRNQSSSADLVTAVMQGRVIYDPEIASQCLAARETVLCERDVAFSDRGTDPVCLEMFKGTVAANGSCTVNEECISQSCARNCPPNTGTCCIGTCVGSRAPAVRALSASCTDRDICTDSFCDTSEPNSTCKAYLPASANCTISDSCAPGLTCKFSADGTTRTCAPLVAVDVLCSVNEDCLALSNVCASDSGAAAKCALGGLTGFTCGGGFTNGGCQQLHYCNSSSSTCALPPMANESCGPINPSAFCVNSYCAGQVCEPYKADGQPCDQATGGTDCESGFCDMTSLCAPRTACP